MTTLPDGSFTRVTAELQLREIESAHDQASVTLASLTALADVSPSDLAEGATLRSSIDSILAAARSVRVGLHAEGRYEEFSHALERCRLDARAALGAVTTLYDRVTVVRRSADSIDSALSACTLQLADARAFHRERASRLFVTLLSAVGAFVFVIAAATLFFEAHAGTLAAGVGRATLLVVGAWTLHLVARSQARHAELAVSYQDRLTSLDTVNALLLVGSLEVREEIIHRLLDHHLASERIGASVGSMGDAPVPRREGKALTTLVTPRRATATPSN